VIRNYLREKEIRMDMGQRSDGVGRIKTDAIYEGGPAAGAGREKNSTNCLNPGLGSNGYDDHEHSGAMRRGEDQGTTGSRSACGRSATAKYCPSSSTCTSLLAKPAAG
jgi:hypothetical protein